MFGFLHVDDYISGGIIGTNRFNILLSFHMVSLIDDDVVGRDSGGEFGRGSEAIGQARGGGDFIHLCWIRCHCLFYCI